MRNLKYLEINKLIKELDWIKSDLKWKSELINSIDKDFLNSVQEFLDKHPDLKTLWDNKFQNEEEIVEEEQTSEVENEEEAENSSTLNDSKLKNLYRQIVKETHPDKIGSNKFSDLYSKATSAYKDGDFLPIIKICEMLGIEWDLDAEQVNELQSEINSTKNKLNFIQTTFTWQWWIEKVVVEKDKIILSYIKRQLIK